MATVEVKYLTQPHDGTPGTPWDDFEERILGVASGKTDERGWSLADTLNDVDEGGAAGPPMPGGAAAAKAMAARRPCSMSDGRQMASTASASVVALRARGAAGGDAEASGGETPFAESGVSHVR